MTQKSFCKPTLNVDQHLKLLRERGLYIPNQQHAKQALSTISYYRFSAYCKPFQNHQNDFNVNTSFTHILNLYSFDRELRLLFVDAIERIEVAFRANISNIMSQHQGHLWYLQSNLFKRKRSHANFLQAIDEICKHPKEDFLQHFFKRYKESYPPSWMVVECLSFGVILSIFKNIKNITYQEQIGSAMNIPCNILESWLTILVSIRNICAHHSRLWDRCFISTPKMPQQYRYLISEKSNKTIYPIVIILNTLLRHIHPITTWLQDLHTLLQKYDTVTKEKMGFQADWQNDLLWHS